MPCVIRFLIIAFLFFTIASSSSIFVPTHLASDNNASGNDEIETQFGSVFSSRVRPLFERYCFQCHSGNRTEAEIDLSLFNSIKSVRQQPGVWQRVGEMLDSRQMPPKESKQPNDMEWETLQKWVRGYLTAEAKVLSGDPGRVILRRLTNAEYRYTLQDLTGIGSLDPAREFPADSAAGEGFTNTGSALVMSPALVSKYLNAAKEVADHAVLGPEGIRFSGFTSRRDWTDEIVHKIRDFYRQYTEEAGQQPLTPDQTGLAINQGGRLPLPAYIRVLMENREALSAGTLQVSDIARQQKLSAKYLALLWKTLESPSVGQNSLLLDQVRSRWQSDKSKNVDEFVREIANWQQALWRFSNVGHVGKSDGPQAWMNPVNPIVARQEFRLKLEPPTDGSDVVLYLRAGNGGDGNRNDDVVWERPRLVVSGRPDLMLRDVRPVLQRLEQLRTEVFSSAAACLDAASAGQIGQEPIDVSSLAKEHRVSVESLSAWLDWLGIGPSERVPIGNLLTRKTASSSGYDFIQRWSGDNALSVVANSSDEQVRIPGIMKPHSVAAHPAPNVEVAIGWRSPIRTTLRVSGSVQDAHSDCGNGVEWSLELRRGATRLRLTKGVTQGSDEVRFGSFENIGVQPGDVIALIVAPRDGNHGCDLTALNLTIRDGSREWDLARDISPNILAGNPHADSYGNDDVWNFFTQPVESSNTNVIPAGSLLARWQSSGSKEERQLLAEQLQALLMRGVAELPKDSPDLAMYHQLTSLRGPLLSVARKSIMMNPATPAESQNSKFGLSTERFGRHSGEGAVEDASLFVRAPEIIEIRLPAEFADGAEFVTSGTLHGESGREGSVDLQVSTKLPETTSPSPSLPIVALEGSQSRARIESALDEFRQLFPPALCYSKIVPVDEVVTLLLYYREDQLFQRLMLDETQIARLNQMWDELFYVSREPLLLVDAFLQKYEYASQLGDPKVFEPLRQPIEKRAAEFRQRLQDTEPYHLNGVLEFAGRAFRRPVSSDESQQITLLYQSLRQQTIAHEEALRLTLASVFVSPAFLYRTEKCPPGREPAPVSDWELANRLSYFLWSSQPDEELRQLASEGKLSSPEVLLAQTKRMLRDTKIRRLATEFGCQWLHIYEFDKLDEKSEKYFPTFADQRGTIYEESIQFFTDLFQNDRSILSLVDADHTFLNEQLATHYGIPNVTGTHWRRIDGVKPFGRGGILTWATTLAKHSGASRTSPILRGAWLSEVVLGEKLPRPPNDVPQLEDVVPAGLTERQLIERHSQDIACAKCHARIDPFGFALEGYDAIGRLRSEDSNRLPIDTRTRLPDGTSIDGLAGLRTYLLTTRRNAFIRQFNRKLLGYALGRSVQLSDEPLLSDLHKRAGTNGAKVGDLVEQIILSRQFRDIRGSEADNEN